MDDGKRVPLSTRVSEATAAALDEARGPMSRSAALDAALSMWLAARNGGPAPASAVTPPAVRKTAARTRRAPVAASVEPKPDAAREVPFSSAPDPCPHPKGRVHKGLCGNCGTHVG